MPFSRFAAAWLSVVILAACADQAPTAPTDDDPPVVEPTDDVPDAAISWLRTAAIPFQGADPTLPHDDLAFLRDLVGDARLVALGEDTHGTEEFFRMKHRVLRYLVEEMGFDAFAIEATWPEAYRVDDYVRSGEGDPARLLSGLYFWTWNTTSVLDLIQWIRGHNAGGGDVGFYGVDMQFPGMALRNVRTYLADVDPGAASTLLPRLECLERHANSPSGAFPQFRYADLDAGARAACGAGLDSLADHMRARKADYEAVAGAERYARGMQSLRVAIQFHLMIHGGQSRDASMAENTLWLLDQLGPEGKVVLWAHNFHVANHSEAQGTYLRDALGDDMVILGFSHEGGSFTAVTLNGGTAVGGGSHSLTPPYYRSYEQTFARSGMDRFALDLRNLSTTSDSTAWLAGPRPFRHIGCCIQPGFGDAYWLQVRLPVAFDAIIHFRETGPTTVLPYNPPDVF